MSSTSYPVSQEENESTEKRFTYVAPKDDQPARYIEIRGVAKDVAKMILTLCPPSRERSLAITKLEEVVMWANASIARNE